MSWRPLAAAATLAILLNCYVACAFTDRTVSDLIAAMRFNDSLLQKCVLEGVVVQKILPAPLPCPHKFHVVIPEGQDISQLPGADRPFELAIKYGNASKIPLSDVPADYLPLVKLLRDEKVVFKSVKDDGPEPITHRTYGCILAQYNSDVAIHMYGGDRSQDALNYALTSQGNKKCSLEYFAGRWERVDTISQFPVNIIHEKALWHCFALGVGFGERVQSATVQTKRRGLYLVDAKIAIWPGQLHDARLLIDESGVVREAEIECETKRVCSVSSTEIRTTDSGTKVASSGRVEVKTLQGRELANLAVDLIEVRSSLKKDDFLTLCDLSIPGDRARNFWQDDPRQAQANQAGCPGD